jgi:4-hydroxybenzoate polyprenyltransferase
LASQGRPPLLLLAVIVLGTLATSAAGCVVNDLWDRNIDPQVERTRSRPLASRQLSIQVGLIVAAIAFVSALGLALYLLRHPLSFWLAVAAVPVIVFYPAAKRVFPIPQLVLSVAWGFAVLISWTAVTGRLDSPAWLLWGATVLWTLGFDTVYALADREDDRRIGVHSSALFFGDRAPLAIGLCYLGTTLLLGWLGWRMGLALPYWLLLMLSAWLWLQQTLRLGQPLNRSDYGRYFQQNVWIGFLLLGGMVLSYWP